MLIICPDCETSYEVEPADLGARGRKVRCAECGSVWRAASEAEKPAAAPDLHPDELADKAVEVEIEEIDVPETAPLPIEAAEDVIVVENSPPRRKGQRRPRGTAPRAMSRPRFMQIMAAAGLAVLVALGVWREQVVKMLPDLAGLYAAAGLPVNLRGLEFRDMKTVEVMEGGVPLLVVRGTIANVKEQAAEVPRMRLAVRGVSGREIFVWTALPQKSQLEAGESVAFTAQLASPPAEGREVAVRFLSARDVAQKPVPR
jgi:predicted Zn finger-like uncharacterized protein